MLERSHLESYICYCKYQKNLNNKTLKAYSYRTEEINWAKH